MHSLFPEILFYLSAGKEPDPAPDRTPTDSGRPASLKRPFGSSCAGLLVVIVTVMNSSSSSIVHMDFEESDSELTLSVIIKSFPKPWKAVGWI